MFLGHYGVALGLKRAEPKLSLGTLFLATQFVDLLWGAFVLLGWERVEIVPGYTAASPFAFPDYPISHSLVAAVAWGAVAAAAYFSWPTRDTARHARAALVVGLAVLSHWWLDVVVHVPDLPLAGNDSPKLGLGLWRRVPATVAVELLLFGAGLALYMSYRSRRHRPRIGPVAAVAAALVVLFLSSLVGPAPATPTQVGVGAIVLIVVAALAAAWADRAAPAAPHR